MTMVKMTFVALENKCLFCVQVFATDADKGNNGRVTYRIVSGNIGNAFVIEPPMTGIVKTNSILDREIVESYKLEIEATDNGKRSLTSTCTLRITVIDVNDNAPFFPQYGERKIKEGV